MSDSSSGSKAFPPPPDGIFTEMREMAAEVFRDTLRANPNASLAELNAALQVRTAAANRRPRPELGGLAPDQVARLLGTDWKQTEGALRLNPDLTLGQLARARTLTNARVFLTVLGETGEIRATPAGNLPRTAVAALVERMDWPEGFVEQLHKYNKVLNEYDVFPLHTLRVLLQLAGLLKLRTGKFSLTHLGVQMRADERAGELFSLLFRTCFRTLNLAYLHPVGPEAATFQHTIAFALYRFGRVAEGWKTPEELVGQILLPVVRTEVPPGSMIDPLPFVLEVRLLRPLVEFGLAELREVPRKDRSWPDHAYRKTRFFDPFLSFELSAQAAGSRATPSSRKHPMGEAKRKAKRGESAGSVYQLEVTLLDIDPPIWRRIQLDGNTTLGELHDVLQVAMGWTNSHLHKFEVGGTEYGPGFAGLDFKNEDSARLRRVAPGKGSALLYTYDFGDSWEHELLVEDVLTPEPGARYPRCVAAERAGPPEDCGGVWGYEELLEILADPAHPEHEERLEWVGGEFDPEAVDVAAINRALARLEQGSKG